MAERRPRAGDTRSRILADLSPVASLPPPGRRALVVLPWLLLSVACVAWGPGWRPDLARIGWLLGPAASTAFLLGGGALIVFALRESVPGAGGSAMAAVLVVSGTLGLRAGVALAVHAAHPHPVPPGSQTATLAACVLAVTALGLPLVAIVAFLARRAYPTRPLRCGLLAGAGAFFAEEALWRLHCPFTDMAHVAGGHVLPGVMLAATGAVLVAVLARRPRREA